jgi:hypothetical protein
MSRYADSADVAALLMDLYAAFDEPDDLVVTPRYSEDRAEFVGEVLCYDRDTIPEQILDLLAWRLVTTVGTPQTMRHYLPRIFEEFLLNSGLDTTDWWVVADKMRVAKFADWRVDQRRLAVLAFKFVIANEILSENCIMAVDMPELVAEAIPTMTMVTLIGLLDPLRDTAQAGLGSTAHWRPSVDFLPGSRGHAEGLGRLVGPSGSYYVRRWPKQTAETITSMLAIEFVTHLPSRVKTFG